MATNNRSTCRTYRLITLMLCAARGDIVIEVFYYNAGNNICGRFGDAAQASDKYYCYGIAVDFLQPPS